MRNGLTQMSFTRNTYSKFTFQFVMAMGATQDIDLDQLYCIYTITDLSMVGIEANLEATA